MIGASVLTRGGLPNGFTFARDCGCESIQLYVTSSRTWVVTPLTEKLEDDFRAAWQTSGVGAAVAHASLLLNLASFNPELRTKSIDHLVTEMHRAARLGITAIVVHPGSNADPSSGVRYIIEALNEVADRTCGVTILIETVAGQGNAIGYRFETLAEILKGVADPARFGVCLDTCHVFAAGYDLRGYAGYENVLAEFDSVVGVSHIRAFHVNDSKVALGRRVDRHADIVGEGHIGIQAFHALLREPRFRDIPMIAEVPDGENLTKTNIDVLKRLRAETRSITEVRAALTLFE